MGIITAKMDNCRQFDIIAHFARLTSGRYLFVHKSNHRFETSDSFHTKLVALCSASKSRFLVKNSQNNTRNY